MVEGDHGLDLGSAQALTADEYLEGRKSALDRDAVVINLCRSYAYLSKGYYVSLLADARGQRAYPTLEMIEQATNPFAYFIALRDAGLDTIDFKLLRSRGRLLPKVIIPEEGRPTVLEHKEREEGEAPRYRAADLHYVEALAVLGRCRDRRFQRAVRTVFSVYAFPLLRVRFYHEEDGWKVGQIFPASPGQLEPEDKALLADRIDARDLRRGEAAKQKAKPVRIACLFDPADNFAPSAEETLEKFERAALKRGALFDPIGPGDLRRLPEFDALFIRSLTGIDAPSYTFAQRAASLGMPVIDDPESISRCSNKVYLHELFQREDIPTPRTLIVSRRTPIEQCLELGPPMIVKLPQGSFSQAVKKADDRKELEKILAEMFKKSPLLIVQEFTPTPFDWRIGVLDGRILFCCKYHQARDHWQIAQRSASGSTRYGKVEAMPNDEVPAAVRRVALRGARLIGDGLYGVDLKEVDGRALMIEINDNPNIDTGYEDAVVKDKLYDAIIASFLRRVRRESTGKA